MKKIFGSLIFLGAVLLLGTAGASDHNTIDGSQIILQVSISAAMIGTGWIGLKAIKVFNMLRATKKNASSTTNTRSVLCVNKECQQQLQEYYNTKKKGCQYYATTKTCFNQFSRH